MRYLHYILDQEGKQIESIYSSNNIAKISMISLRLAINGEYKVWDKETNEIISY